VIGHTSSFPVVGNQGRREEENNAPKGGRGAQTYVQTGQAKNHTDPHDPQMNHTSLQCGSILIDRSYKP